MALLSNVALGIAAGALTVLCAPVLIRYGCKVPVHLQAEARHVMYVVALAMPLLVLQAALRGILSSYQRFDWINLVNGALVTLQWTSAWLLGRTGLGVSVVVLSIVAVRVAGTAVFFVLLLRLCPNIEWQAGCDTRSLLRLYRFGSWVSVSQIVSPLLVYLDRLLIGAFLSLRAVSLYTVPCEAVFRLRVLPLSAASTLFPAFSEGGASGNRHALQNLYRRSVHYLFMLLLPGVIFFVVLGKDVLGLWLGWAFAEEASPVIQILALGVLANGLANVPSNTLQALGRPDLTGKFHMLELPIYLSLCVALIPHWGIAGAAVANTVRVTLDASLLFIAARKHFSLDCAWSELGPCLALGLLLLLALLGDVHLFDSAPARLIGGVLLSGLYFLAVWVAILKDTDRPAIGRLLRSFRTAE